jgi:SanA protein
MKKKLIISILIFGLISVVLIIAADIEIGNSTDNLVFDNVESIPYNRVGLLLGASKLSSSGNTNLYFKKRTHAAVELYNARKIDFIVISGDNSRIDYNEPKDMQDELIRLGIPSNRIYLDYAGFRTFDSVIRINKIFGQTNFTLISQNFHNRRAIYIAQYHGLNAVGYNAADIEGHLGLKTNIREMFARVKVFWDLLFNVEPKFLGEPIDIAVK